MNLITAKILQGQKIVDSNLWKYDFFDTQTGIKDHFYSGKKLKSIPEIAGRLELSLDDQQNKTLEWFSQDIHKLEVPNLVKFEQPLEKEEIKTESTTKKIITKLTPQQIRKLREKDFSWQEIREFCNVSEWTVRRWRKEEENKEKKKVGRPPKIKGYDLSFLKACRTIYNDQTQKWVAEVYSEKLGQSVSASTICRLYKKYGISHLKPTIHYSEQQLLLDKIKPFTNYVKSLPQPLLLATDECAFYLNEAPRKLYGWKGERVISWKPGNFVARYTLILCIRNTKREGIINWKLIEKGAKAIDFYNFFYKTNFAEKHYLLLDNAKIHHAKQLLLDAGIFPIKELLIGNNIQPIFLIPYTPQLNPVELCFNFLSN